MPLEINSSNKENVSQKLGKLCAKDKVIHFTGVFLYKNEKFSYTKYGSCKT